MIVMDEENCMVDMARYFVRFLQEESVASARRAGKAFSRWARF